MSGIAVRLMMWLYVPVLLSPYVVLPGLVAVIWASTEQFPVFIAAPLMLMLLVHFVHVLVAVAGLLSGISQYDPMEFEVAPKLLAPLYDLTEEVADWLNVALPHEIRLSADSVAHVYEERKGRRILVVGAMALASLSKDALSGIIAHELGHFAAGDTRLSRQATRLANMMSTFEEIFFFHPVAWVNPLGWVIFLYHWVFCAVWAMNSRRQKYAADRFMVEQAGQDIAAASLMRIIIMEQMPWTRLESIIRTSVDTQAKAIFTEQSELAEFTSGYYWEEAARKEWKKKTKLLDSHPSLKDRLQAIGVKPKRALHLALEPSGPPMRKTFANWPELETVMSVELVVLFRGIQNQKKELAQVFGSPSY